VDLKTLFKGPEFLLKIDSGPESIYSYPIKTKMDLIGLKTRVSKPIKKKMDFIGLKTRVSTPIKKKMDFIGLETQNFAKVFEAIRPRVYAKNRNGPEFSQLRLVSQ
jgi:hypothetical protein